MTEAATRAWWGTSTFALEQQRHWQIGPLDLWVKRLQREWLVQRRHGLDPLDSSLVIAAEASVDPGSEGEGKVEVDRIVGEESCADLMLAPLLADRPVVVRPAHPLRVLAGTRIQLFLSAPLWVRLSLSGPNDSVLLEVPIFRPSDTWFGPSTIEGVPAYAVSTTCRLDVAGLPVRPHRAVTSVLIENRAKEPLVFERLSVPVGRLSLYAAAGSRLWTDTLAVKHHEPGSGLADVQTLAGPPQEAGEYELLAGPRETGSGEMLRVFDQLF